MTRITTEFGHDTTAEEVVHGIDLTGKRIIVTGAASGIGVETARALARTGAEVTLAVRDVAAGERTARDISETTGNRDVRVARLDLADRPRSRPSSRPGTARCTSSSTTRGDGDPRAAAHAGGLGAAVRDEPPRALRARARAARRARRRRRRAHRGRQLGRAPAVARRLRRHPLRAPPVRAVAGLRPVQDRQRAVRGRGHAPLGGRRHHRERAHAGRDHRHEPAALHGRGRARLAGRVRARRGCAYKTVEQGAATSAFLVARRRRSRASAAATSRTATRRGARRRRRERVGVRGYALDPEAAERLWEVSLRMLEARLPAAA